MENAAAYARLQADGGTFALCDWREVVFVHLALDPKALAPHIPFPLDLYGAEAYVSLVAFFQENFRTPLLGGLPSPLLRPLGSYPICNLRTYVRCGGEPGVHFIREWEPNPLSAAIVPLVYGLPQRVARIRHEQVDGRYSGIVARRDRSLHLEGDIPAGGPFEVAALDLNDFLSERFTAFQHVLGLPMRFRLWHPHWRQAEARITVQLDSLPRATAPWWGEARPIAASYSPGLARVQLGRPTHARGGG